MISVHGFKGQDIFDIIALIIVIFFILVGIYAIYANLRKDYNSSKHDRDKHSSDEYEDH